MNEIKVVRIQYDFPIEFLEEIAEAAHAQKLPDYLFDFGEYVFDFLGEIFYEISLEDIPETGSIPSMSDKKCYNREQTILKLLFKLEHIEGELGRFIGDEIRRRHPNDGDSFIVTGDDIRLLKISDGIFAVYDEFRDAFYLEGFTND